MFSSVAQCEILFTYFMYMFIQQYSSYSIADVTKAYLISLKGLVWLLFFSIYLLGFKIGLYFGVNGFASIGVVFSTYSAKSQYSKCVLTLIARHTALSTQKLR